MASEREELGASDGTAVGLAPASSPTCIATAAAAASSTPNCVGSPDRAISHVCGVAKAAPPPRGGVGDRRVLATEAALDARGSPVVAAMSALVRTVRAPWAETAAARGPGARVVGCRRQESQPPARGRRAGARRQRNQLRRQIPCGVTGWRGGGGGGDGGGGSGGACWSWGFGRPRVGSSFLHWCRWGGAGRWRGRRRG